MRRIGKGADRLDGQHGSFYLNYNNLINTPTIPSGNQIIDWTASGVGTIHASNYVDNNTTYSVGDGGLTEKNFTATLKTKLDGIATSAEVNVQSDWNATAGDALILNKPTIPTNNNQLTNGSNYITNSVGSFTIDSINLDQNGSVTQNLKFKTTTSGASDVGMSFYNGSDTWTMQLYGHTSGYGFLNSNWASWDIKKVPNGQMEVRIGTTLQTVYHTGNLPTIPTNNNQLTNGAGYVTDSGWTSSNDGAGSGLDADLLDGVHYDSRWLNGSSGQNHYVSANYGYNWFRPVNDTGLYLNSYGAHWKRTMSSYGTWQAYGYTVGSYVGLQTYYSYQNNLMYDSGGNGGVYQQNGAGWHFYYHRGNACLGVNGSTTNSSYELYLNGDLYATGNVVAYSDARAKENIETIDNALDKVSKLRGVYYTWKKGERGKDKARKEGKRQMGVIAQEVMEVCPEVVFQETDDMDRYSVDYGKLTGVLIEAVKNLKKEINELKSN